MIARVIICSQVKSCNGANTKSTLIKTEEDNGSLHLQNKEEIRRLYYKLREEKRRPYTYGLGLSVADRRGKEKQTRRN